MFNFKVALLVVIVGAFLMQETEAHPKLKLKLLKAKLIGSHIAAKVAVGKKIKAKTAIAAAKTIAAIKAKKAAVLSIITAPIAIAKKSLAIKVKKVKAVKAAKIATLAAGAIALKKLKKTPIILPIPYPVPLKGDISKLGALGGLGGLGALGGLGGLGALGSISKSLGGIGLGGDASIALDAPSSVGPIQGLITGAQKVLTTAGGALPFLSTLNNGVGLSKTVGLNQAVVAPAPAPVVIPQPVVFPQPVYRFVPDIGFANYNRVSYQPHVEVEVPAPIPEVQISNHGSSHIELPPPQPFISEYGPPADTYGTPHF